MEIRDYVQGDETQILELFKIVYEKPMQINYWKWRFRDNPAGNHMIKLMWNNNKCVGHYAVSLVSLKIEGNQNLSAQSMTTMTHPAYSGKGIFGSLANALYDDLENKHGVKAIWGFPNNNSHKGFIKNLNWVNLGLISHLILKPDKIKTTVNKNITLFTYFNKDHFILIDSITNQFPVSVNRDKNYLVWRYENNPTNSYDKFEYLENNNLMGFIIVKKYPNTTLDESFDLYITEVGIPIQNIELLRIFISYLISYYGNQVSTIRTWLSLFDQRYIYLEKIGFEPGGKPTYIGVRTGESYSNTLKDFRNWYLSYGDSDVY